MRQDGLGHLANVVRKHEVPAVQRCRGLRRAEQLKKGTRARAQAQERALPGGPAYRHRVFLDCLGDVHLLHGGDHRRHLGGGDNGGDAAEWRHCLVGLEHVDLGIPVRISHGNPGHEAVALGLRQGIGAFHLDRILRSHHHERLVEVIGGAVHRDLVFLHALKESRLGLGRRPVDLIPNNDIGENSARPELEVP